MATKKASQKTYTVNEAAKKLGVTRAAIHKAIKDGRLEFEWGETVQVIKKKARLIPAKALSVMK
jgi:biotin operon repressor